MKIAVYSDLHIEFCDFQPPTAEVDLVVLAGDISVRGRGVGCNCVDFGAAYTLWMFKRVYLGPVGNSHVKELTDIGSREFLILSLLAIAVLAMGLYPRPFTDVMDTSVAELLKHVALQKLN